MEHGPWRRSLPPGAEGPRRDVAEGLSEGEEQHGEAAGGLRRPHGDEALSDAARAVAGGEGEEKEKHLYIFRERWKEQRG